jgi:hypothetical protein
MAIRSEAEVLASNANELGCHGMGGLECNWISDHPFKLKYSVSKGKEKRRSIRGVVINVEQLRVR